MSQFKTSYQDFVNAFSSLGLPITASRDQVDRNFREYCRKIHPDKNNNEDATRKCQELETFRNNAILYISLCKKVEADKDFYMMVLDLSYPSCSHCELPSVCQEVDRPEKNDFKLMARAYYELSRSYNLFVGNTEQRLVKERSEYEEKLKKFESLSKVLVDSSRISVKDVVNETVIQNFVSAHLGYNSACFVSTNEITEFYIRKYELHKFKLDVNTEFPRILKVVVLKLYSGQPGVEYTQRRIKGVKYRGYNGIYLK